MPEKVETEIVAACINQISKRQSDKAGERGDAIGFVVELEAGVSVAQFEARLGVSFKYLVGDEAPFKSAVSDLGGGRAKTNFFYVEIPDVRYEDLEMSPFDLTNYLHDSLDAISVEPDLETEFFGLQTLAELSNHEEAENPTVCEASDTVRLANKKDTKIKPSKYDYGWPQICVKAHHAWNYSTDQGKPSHGDGIRIAQIDTGYTSHRELAGAVDAVPNSDVIDNDSRPEDPLAKFPPFWPFLNPGHGTATGSVTASRGEIDVTTLRGVITGAAPKATLAPYRAIRSVIRLKQGKVAEAIKRITELGGDDKCQIITMSLGGVPLRVLREKLEIAVQKGFIVIAAAGQVFPWVVWPARYEQCISISGTRRNGKPWKAAAEGTRLGHVDVSAPAKAVWHARGKEKDVTEGDGTSFATAIAAGVAALWLAHFGKDTIANAANTQGTTVQELFRRKLIETVQKGKWKQNKKRRIRHGAGIVDALALLKSDPFSPSFRVKKTKRISAGNSYWKEIRVLSKNFGVVLTKADVKRASKEAVLQKYSLEVLWLMMLIKLREKDEESWQEYAAPIPRMSVALARAINGTNIALLDRLRGRYRTVREV